jgi:uncharacterized membrane protein
MAYERIKSATLPHALSEVMGDLSDLFQKEIRLAKAELSARVAEKLSAGIWMAVAGVVSLFAILILLEAIIFAISSFGLALHWSCLIVAGALLAIAAAAFFKGRAQAQETLAPTRTIEQVRRDISTAKEQLT